MSLSRLKGRKVDVHLWTPVHEVESSALDQLKNLMEEKGLVQRQRSSASDREVVAKLTPKGEALFQELFPATVNYGAKLLNTGLPPDELRTLAALLDKL